MTAVRIVLFLALLAFKALGALPPATVAGEEAAASLLEVETEADGEDDTSLGDPMLAHPSHPAAVERELAFASLDARGPDEPHRALADRPPSA